MNSTYKIPVVIKSENKSYNFIMAVADTSHKRNVGLMFVESLEADEGMIFIYDLVDRISMWMKNTPLSLDMIFLDEKKKIVNVVENTVPFSLDSISSEKSAKYVIEIKAGESAKRGIKSGDAVEFELPKMLF